MRFLISTANYFSDQDTYDFLARLSDFSEQKTIHEFSVQLFDNSASMVNLNESDYGNLNLSIVKPKRNIGLGPTWKISLSTMNKCKDYDALILVNNDTEFCDGFFDEILFAVNKNDNSIYGPYIMLEDETPWSSGGHFGLLPWIVKHHAQKRDKYDERIIETEHVSGCCLIIPRKVILKNYHAFSGVSDFFFRGEEWFLNKKLADSGVNRFLLRDAILIHKENGSHKRFSPEHIYWAIRAKMLFIKKLNGIQYFLSFLTYSVHVFTKGFIFYKIHSGLSGGNVMKMILMGYFHGVKKRVIRSYDL
ncbi:glycosyltransferase family 2 protein [Musicola keenii]|uniref:glycosyltransferase family 2 protein n=1 Tax=Musicola keenii TaxID=2884250 RepID=UPI00177BFC6A|nr:hypothetical protein [Musicola keenii]